MLVPLLLKVFSIAVNTFPHPFLPFNKHRLVKLPSRNVFKSFLDGRPDFSFCGESQTAKIFFKRRKQPGITWSEIWAVRRVPKKRNTFTFLKFPCKIGCVHPRIVLMQNPRIFHEFPLKIVHLNSLL